MKKSLAIAAVAAALLAACDSSAPATGSGSVASRAAVSSSSRAMSGSAVSSVAARPRAKEGEACGGIAGIQCDPGLICLYDGAYPDAGGTCSK